MWDHGRAPAARASGRRRPRFAADALDEDPRRGRADPLPAGPPPVGDGRLRRAAPARATTPPRPRGWCWSPAPRRASSRPIAPASRSGSRPGTGPCRNPRLGRAGPPVSKRQITVSVDKLRRRRPPRAPRPAAAARRRALLPALPEPLAGRGDAPQPARLRRPAGTTSRSPRASASASSPRAAPWRRALAGAARERPAAVRRPRSPTRTGWSRPRPRRQRRGADLRRDRDPRPPLRRGGDGLLVPGRQHGRGGGREARPRRRALRRRGAAAGRASPPRAAPGCRRACIALMQMAKTVVAFELMHDAELPVDRGARPPHHRRRLGVVRLARRRDLRRAGGAHRLLGAARDRADHAREAAARLRPRRDPARQRPGRRGGRPPRADGPHRAGCSRSSTARPASTRRRRSPGRSSAPRSAAEAAQQPARPVAPARRQGQAAPAGGRRRGGRR